MSRILLFLSIVLLCLTSCTRNTIYVSGNPQNDLCRLLQAEGADVKIYKSPLEAVKAAPEGAGVMITAPGYPASSVILDKNVTDLAAEKGLRLYAEYVSAYPGMTIQTDVVKGTVERAVVATSDFEPLLQPMELLSINDTHYFKAEADSALLVFARVAGFDTATYGLADTEVSPLLVKADGGNLIAFTSLTNFETGRYAPCDHWQALWTAIMRYVTCDESFEFKHWPSDPRPAYGRNDVLADGARRDAVRRSVEWLGKGHFLIHPSWRDSVLKYQGDGLMPVGPSVPASKPDGDGKEGLLEGHASNIYYDGTEQYRYWLRADVQGEGAFLLASAAKLLDEPKYGEVAENLLGFVFDGDIFRDANMRDPKSDAYGLIGWSMTHPYVFYNDDNARLLLGAIGASAILETDKWNKDIVECILANFRMSNANGFIPDRVEEPDLLANGLEHYSGSDLVLPHPHFESWMWACYLWLYDKTGYEPLLDRARKAIAITMSKYPDEWSWTNGIQQERARMVLPLAWLVRVDDTPEHRQWLDMVVCRLLENQDASGAIREELGDASKGVFGFQKSNKDYGISEAPLIAANGDPVADMLYTNNFAFFALNEAAAATGEQRYRDAADRLSDFLVRIQARSDRHPDLDGAWMRAFDYDRWDYYASNADQGWGAWSTLTGWIQSWITATQAMMENNTSFWEITKGAQVADQVEAAMWMLKE